MYQNNAFVKGFFLGHPITYESIVLHTIPTYLRLCCQGFLHAWGKRKNEELGEKRENMLEKAFTSDRVERR